MKAIVEHFKEFGDFYIICCGLFIAVILCFYGFFEFYSLLIDVNDKESLVAKVDEYEKILEREFGQTFNSYNEYLVYKIENGGVD